MYMDSIKKTFNHKQLLTTEQAAQRLGVTPHTLSVWRCTKRYPLRYIKIGRCVRYQLNDIEQFISQNTQHMDC